ncbi:HtaA domain-containing protein [Corynebacterium sp. CCM 9185]|uniref:HtaA domain-containing protein n=1 Tax=Corynebacterium marambiense TaxID=2765364 RepID=A0ABS0VRG0_9CORY|nr:HtaA domain-containing protein [Corynebacterium marambiense]MBI8999380.1 HtaA domain-containing protein [Corynebacterium marambiense]MCK7662220.1 HtaA domain-containing protein [Corynebacterium marambiense]MCX7541489.1 HtaA domain-containing protein [Corynebacterium marambiense]
MTLRSPFTKIVRRITAVAAATAAAGFLVLPVLPATAEDCSESYTKIDGAMRWGFKKSFRSYIQSGGTKGGWELDGMSYDSGSEQFVLTPDPDRMKVVDADTATIPLQGSLRFFGHEGEGGQGPGKYALDFTLSDMKLVVDGTSATLVVDYRGLELEPGTTMVSGEKSANDADFMDIQLAQAPDFTSGSLDLNGSVNLSADGASIFAGFYEPGQEFDPISLAATLEKVCGKQPQGGSDGGSGTSGGKNTGTKSVGIDAVNSVNDHLDSLNNLMGTADKFMGNSDKLYKRFTDDRNTLTGSRTTTDGTSVPGATTGGTGGKTTTGKTTGAGTGTTSGAGTRSGTSGAASAPRGAAAGGTTAGANTGGGDVCTDDGSLGVVEAQAAWGVKTSFQTYISGSIANGGWELNGVGHNNGQFLFSGNSGAVNPSTGAGSLLMSGSVRFTGHGGVLDLTIADPEVQWNGASGVLIANVTSNDMEGNSNNFGRVALANLTFSQLDVSPTEVSGQTSSVSLTQAGSTAFADFYPAGQEMAPLSFAATLGGSASCASGQGSGAPASGGGGGAAARVGATTAGASGSSTKKAGLPGAAAGEDSGSFHADKGGSGRFKIKSSGPNKSPETENVAASSETETLVTPLLLILAAFVVAGSTLTSFVSRNPAG